jgi:hypothetical protein
VRRGEGEAKDDHWREKKYEIDNRRAGELGRIGGKQQGRTRTEEKLTKEEQPNTKDPSQPTPSKVDGTVE